MIFKRAKLVPQERIDASRERMHNYVYDQVQGSGDPLITRIAQVPIHTEYVRLFREGNLPSSVQVGRLQPIPYTSIHHMNLLLLLHRLGLRGRP